MADDVHSTTILKTNTTYPKRDLAGQRFGHWKVLRFAGRGLQYKPYWECQCDCGIVQNICWQKLCEGKSKGCRVCRATEHGHCKSGKRTRTYHTWVSMIQRCENQKHKQYIDYGGRGISVCAAWRTSFEQFLFDIGERPHGMTLNRIDNNQGYSSENCNWSDKTEQQNNMRSNTLLSFQDVTHTIAEWTRIKGYSRTLIDTRLRLGWSTEKALSTPVKPHAKYKSSH